MASPADASVIPTPAGPEGASLVRRVWRRAISDSATVWFVAVAVPFGLLFALTIPPSQGIDESSHFFRAWFVSTGDVVAQSKTDETTRLRHAGGEIDPCVVSYISGFQDKAYSPDDYSIRSYWTQRDTCGISPSTWYNADAAANYPPAAYFPQAVAIAASRAVGAPLAWSFFLGRLAGLVAFVLLGAIGIHLLPLGKGALMVIGLLPTSIMSAATYNADMTSIGLAMFGVGLVGHCISVKTISVRSLVALSATFGLLGAIKPPYAVLSLVVLLIPWLPGASWIRAFLTRCVVPLAAGCLSGLWLVVGSAPAEPAVFRSDIDHAEQARFILGHPLSFLATVARTLTAAGPQSYTLRGAIGSFGMGRFNGRSNDVVAPLGLLVVAAMTFAVAFRADLAEPKINQSRWRGFVGVSGPLAVGAAGLVMVYAAMYLIWSPVGSPYVLDVQGRYLLPVACVVALIPPLTRFRKSSTSRKMNWIGLTAAAVLLYAVGKSFLIFY